MWLGLSPFLSRQRGRRWWEQRERREGEIWGEGHSWAHTQAAFTHRESCVPLFPLWLPVVFQRRIPAVVVGRKAPRWWSHFANGKGERFHSLTVFILKSTYVRIRYPEL